MQLWYSDSNSPVKVGDIVHLFKDKHPCVVIHVPTNNTEKKGLEVLTMDDRRRFMQISPSWVNAYWK